jgi:hypothetical protein
MAIERGDWVKHRRLGIEGEVKEVRGSRAKVLFNPAKNDIVAEVPVRNISITTRPQTGQGR